MTMQPRTSEVSARSAARTICWYHSGKSSWRVGEIAGASGIRKALEKPAEELGAALEFRNVNVLVRGVRLPDRARPHRHGGRSGGRKDRGIAEPRGANQGRAQ